ncbi:hypothetical protein B0H19DRAFT_1010092 [Mycena capillaripes]|nr:hypothetical protein B0H19DRAFT_1010092 [Mycena capillaripes]
MVFKHSLFRNSLGPIALLPFLLALQNFTPAIAAALPCPDRSNNSIRWVDCHDKVPAELKSTLNVTSGTTLPSNLFCGQMDVPMDYTKAFDAVTNNITIGFAMNRPANLKNSSGLIFYHAGGPGLPATPMAWQNAFNLSSGAFTGLENFDFLAIDSRGLEFSNPIPIPSGQFFNNISFALPSTQDEFNQYQAAMTNFYSSLINNSKPVGIVQHLGTVEVIQDWDSVRAALGYEKANLAAVSYGTFVGMAYAGRFPERVDRFVLDAVIPHGLVPQDGIAFQVAAANRLVQRADAFCLTDPTCPFHGQGNGSVVKAWQTVLAQAAQTPLPALSCGPETGCKSPVTVGDLQQGVPVIMRANPDFPLFNIALNASLHGDASLFAFEPAGDIRETPVSPLLCSDFGLDPDMNTFAGFQNFTANSQKSDPLNIGYSQIFQMFLQCSVWPFSVPPRVTLPTDLKLMWMTSDFDLNLPTELTTFAWKQAPNSTLVIRHGDDHTTILNPSPLTRAEDVAKDFIRTGVIPQPRSDAQVTILGPGDTRGPLPGAYDVPTGAAQGDTSTVENIV